jgi:hypothetical protein
VNPRIKHDVGKVFNADNELIGGTVFLTPEEVEQLERQGRLEIQAD